MNTARTVAGISAMLLVPALVPAGAQVIRQPIGTPRLPPPPAAVMSSINQTQGAIFPQVWFQVPSGTASIQVYRSTAGGAAVLVTPTPVPLASVPTPTGQYYYWIDNTLNALGSFSYSVAAIQGDGRGGVSTPMAYSPRIDEPTSVAIRKADPFTAIVSFGQAKLPAQTYRLYGTGLVTYGVQATLDPRGTVGAVTVGNLAAGTYNWVLRSEYAPGIRSNGVPVTVTLP